MRRSALVLAAHGSRVDPRTNQALAELAERVAARRLFDEVAVAFHQGNPTFAEVLDELSSEETVVVPVMTSAGHYCDEVLPRELAKNRRFAQVQVRQTPPVGLHRGLPDLVDSRARNLAAGHRLDPARTALAVVGHGTARNAKSRLAAEALADSLSAGGVWGQVLIAFLDEEPGVETILPRATQANVLVMPFLVSGGPHVTVDIPTRLGIDRLVISTLPAAMNREGGTLVLDRAIGSDEGMLEIVLDLGMRGRAAFRTRSASDGSDPALALGVRNEVVEVFR